MKFYDVSVLIILIVIGVTAAVGAISYKLLGPDNVITKDAETVLETEGEVLLNKVSGVTTPVTPSGATGATGSAN